MLIWNDLHLNVLVGNNRSNNIIRLRPYRSSEIAKLDALIARTRNHRRLGISEIGFGSVQFLSARSWNRRAKVPLR
jgi:hypothetical protein